MASYVYYINILLAYRYIAYIKNVFSKVFFNILIGHVTKPTNSNDDKIDYFDSLAQFLSLNNQQNYHLDYGSCTLTCI